MLKRHHAGRVRTTRAEINFALKKEILRLEHGSSTTPRIISNIILEPPLSDDIIEAIKRRPVKAPKNKIIPIEYLDVPNQPSLGDPIIINLDSNDVSDAETKLAELQHR